MDMYLTIEQAMLISSIGLVLATCGLVWFTWRLFRVTGELNAIERRRDETMRAERIRIDLEMGILRASQVINMDEGVFTYSLTTDQSGREAHHLALVELRNLAVRLDGPKSNTLAASLDSILTVIEMVLSNDGKRPPIDFNAFIEDHRAMKGRARSAMKMWVDRLRAQGTGSTPL